MVSSRVAYAHDDRPSSVIIHISPAPGSSRGYQQYRDVAVREGLGDDAGAARTEVLTPGEHEQVGRCLVSYRNHVVGGNAESANELDPLVRGRDVAGEELLLPGLGAMRFVVRERGDGGRRVDVEHDDFELVLVRELDRLLERMRAFDGPFERNQDVGDALRVLVPGVARRRPVCQRA